MKNIDYDNINFNQFLEILPGLIVFYCVGLDIPELLLMTFPVYDEDEEVVLKHIVSGYREEGGSVIIQPLGIIEGHEHPGLNVTIGYDDFVSEKVCLLSGRLSPDGNIAFSSIQGCLNWDETHCFMPYDLQGGGEVILKKLFGFRQFSRAQIGKHFFRTAVSEGQRDELRESNPFTTIAVDGPPM